MSGQTHRQLREPAVAGFFYPADRDALQQAIADCLDTVRNAAAASFRPLKAIIAPHAGYIYSGPIAASAYARIAAQRGRIRRVILLGPSHRVAFAGLALPSVDAFLTPLGSIPLAHDAMAALSALPQVTVLDAAHSLEHSLEVHLPFLQAVLDEFDLVPLVVGEATDAQVGEALELVWGGEETLVVVSSDLSHYHDYDTACRLDGATTRAIEELDGTILDGEHACGCRPIRGLLRVARHHHLQATTLDQRNSGDTAGDSSRVVGYGAYAFA